MGGGEAVPGGETRQRLDAPAASLSTAVQTERRGPPGTADADVSRGSALTSAGRVGRVALWVLAIVVPIGQIAGVLWLIWTQTPKVPWGDEWAMVPILQRADAGTLSFADLWAVHNRSHRIVLPRLLDLFLIDATHWNRQLLMPIDLAIAIAAGVLIFACVRASVRNRGVVLALLAPLALLYFSFAQYENWVLPWQLSYILTIFGVTCCLYGFHRLHGRERPTNRAREWAWFAVALVGAVIASLSTFNGLFAWVAFLPSAARQRDGWAPARVALWIASALAIGIPYAIGFSGEHSTSLLHLAAFFVAALGAPLGTMSLAVARLFGLLGLAGMGLALFGYWRLFGELWSAAEWIELAAFSALTTVATTLGRAVYGNGLALISRYQDFSCLWWVALCVLGTLVVRRIVADRQQGRSSALFPDTRYANRYAGLAVRAGIALLLVCTIGCVASGIAGARIGLDWLAPMNANQSCLLENPSPPQSCMEPYFLEGLIPLSDQDLLAYIRTHHLALYDQ